jgi:hypothetical protein
MSEFFPTDYTPAAGGGDQPFVKIKDESRLRVLQPPFIYFQGWKEVDGKPKPVRSLTPFPSGETWKEAPKQVVGLFVWDYNEDRVGFWEVPQAGIQRELYNLSKDADFGDPRQYDIKVSKTGSGKETKYSLRPMPPKAVPSIVQAAWEEVMPKIDMQGYIDGKALFV